MNQMVRYDAAKKAIAEYKTVDEVKDFRDKALAIEAYAKQANDFDLEHDAAAARVRAERKCGQLLADQEKAKGTDYGGTGHDSRSARPSFNPPKTLAGMGITKDQSSKWQKLAAVPDDEFEQAISSREAKPSTANILKPKQEPAERMDESVLWWWGRFCDMERRGFSVPLSSVVSEMTDAMQKDADRIIPQLKKWVNSYE